MGTCFSFNARCGDVGCFTAGDSNFPIALARPWFVRLETVYASVRCLEIWGLFRGYTNARAGYKGLVSQLVVGCFCLCL